MTLNQERKRSPHLRESCEIHSGVNQISRRKKSLCFSGLFGKNKTKQNNDKPRQHFYQSHFWTVSLMEELLSLKVKCQSRTYYLELVYLLLLLTAHTWLKGCRASQSKALDTKNPTSILHMLQQLLCQTNCNLVPLTEHLLAVGLD